MIQCMATTTTAATYLLNSNVKQPKKLKSGKKKVIEICNDSNQDGLGHRERTVKCQNHNGQEIPDYHCLLLNKRPDHIETCILNRKNCLHNNHFRWQVGNWSQCSKNCGTKGVKTRTVECTKMGFVDKINTSIVVDEKF